MQFVQNFSVANTFTQKWEKGYVNHPNDPGGATYNGVSLRFLKQTGTDINGDGIIDARDILDLYRRKDQESVDLIFYKAFWRDPMLDQYASLPVQIALYDCNVNTGRTQSVKCLQKACNFIKGASCLIIDGIAGSRTVSLCKEIIAEGSGFKLALACIEERLAFHNMLAEKSPYPDGRDYRPFIKGWRNRVNDLKQYAARFSK